MIEVNKSYSLRGSARVRAEVIQVTSDSVTFHSRMFGYLSVAKTITRAEFIAQYAVPSAA